MAASLWCRRHSSRFLTFHSPKEPCFQAFLNGHILCFKEGEPFESHESKAVHHVQRVHPGRRRQPHEPETGKSPPGKRRVSGANRNGCQRRAGIARILPSSADPHGFSTPRRGWFGLHEGTEKRRP